MMKIRLHWKLTLIFCSAVLCAFFAGSFFLVSHLKTYVENNLRNSITRQLYLSKDFLEASLNQKKSIFDYQSFANDIGRALDLRVTIIALDGTVLGDTDLTVEQLRAVENHANRPEIKEALKGGFGMIKRYSYTVKKEMLYIAVPFGGEKMQGVLRHSVPLQDISLLQQKMLRVVGISILVILLVSLGLTYVVALFVSKPLAEMSLVATAMTRGDFSRKSPVRSQDEVGTLARSLNALSEEIKDTIDKVSTEKTKLDLVLSSMFEGVVVTDEEEKIILMNPSLRRIFLIEQGPEGKTPLEVFRNNAVQDIVDRILKGKQRLTTEEITVNAPEEKILKVNAVPILRNDKIEGAILVFHDITALRRLEQIRQDFVANVSHELRTPIASIKGYAETLLEGALDDREHAKEFIGIILHDADRLAALINDLLDLSKIESGRLKMFLMALDPVSALKRAITVLEPQAKAKSITISLQCAPKAPEIYADETRFAQVLINLLDNAIKYTEEKGTVIVSSVVEGSFLRIDVTDTGIGISEKDLPRIFERFYRVDKARSRELGGTGLGLSIVKHIVQTHGGNVSVRSQLGAGSTFSFTIPLAQ